MGIRTGRPHGRPKGAKNKHTEMRLVPTKERTPLMDKESASKFDGNAVEFLISVYMDTTQLKKLRIDAGRAARHYVCLPPVEGLSGDDLLPRKRRPISSTRLRAFPSNVVELKPPSRRR